MKRSCNMSISTGGMTNLMKTDQRKGMGMLPDPVALLMSVRNVSMLRNKRSYKMSLALSPWRCARACLKPKNTAAAKKSTPIARPTKVPSEAWLEKRAMPKPTRGPTTLLWMRPAKTVPHAFQPTFSACSFAM